MKEALEEVLADLWTKSQGDHIIIRDAGIIQDCVMRVAEAVGIDTYL